MTTGDRAAIDVHLLRIKPELFHRRQRHHRKRFADLKQVNRIER